MWFWKCKSTGEHRHWPPLIQDNLRFLILLSLIIVLAQMCRSKESQTFHTYVQGTIVLQNSYSVPQNTLLQLISGLLDVLWLNYCLDRLVKELPISFNCFLDWVLNLLKKSSVWIFQPLFPGESGVDQLVEIIKVIMVYYCTSTYVVHSWNEAPDLFIVHYGLCNVS